MQTLERDTSCKFKKIFELIVHITVKMKGTKDKHALTKTRLSEYKRIKNSHSIYGFHSIV